jgi:hypothetical protein
MLNSLNITFILLPILPIFTVLLLIYRRRINRESNLIKRGFRLFKLNLILIGAFTGIAWLLSFGLTPSLSTFGYPETIEDIQNPEQILNYLQQYNRALVTNLLVFNWFIVTFSVWFLSSLYGFARTITNALLARPVER